METKLKQIIRKYRTQPDSLLSALSEITPSELVSAIVDLLTARELRLHSRKRKRLPLCQRFYRYDEVNPHVGEWLLTAAQELKDKQHRERYGMGALLEEMRWDARLGISKTDRFRISNDYQACYVRQLLMRDPSLCGLFEVQRTCGANELIVDGRPWADFAKEHEAELWPEPTLKKKPNSAQLELALGETA
jgi:hypothetical protein